MNKFEDKLNNKIKELNCIMEIIINNYKGLDSVIKQVEDVIPSLSSDAT
jgi:hypothetical protein